MFETPNLPRLNPRRTAAFDGWWAAQKPFDDAIAERDDLIAEGKPVPAELQAKITATSAVLSKKIQNLGEVLRSSSEMTERTTGRRAIE